MFNLLAGVLPARRSEAHRGLPEARPRTQNVLARGRSEAHGDSNLYNTIVRVGNGDGVAVGSSGKLWCLVEF